MVEASWNVTARGDAREWKWRGNWRMERVTSTLHTTLQHGVSSITTADAHTSAASSRLNWRPRRFKRTRPFRRKTKSGFCDVYNHISTGLHTWPSELCKFHSTPSPCFRPVFFSRLFALTSLANLHHFLICTFSFPVWRPFADSFY